MVERDAMAWFVDLATVAAGLAGAVALWMSHRAIRDSSATARELAESRHLADLARKRAEAEQAARVLGIADELAGNIRGRWQCTLVPLKNHPSAGQVNGLLGSLKRDLELVSELRARASAIDLETVQLALLIHSRLVGFEGLLEKIENQAHRAADANVATRAQHLERWHLVRERAARPHGRNSRPPPASGSPFPRGTTIAPRHGSRELRRGDSEDLQAPRWHRASLHNNVSLCDSSSVGSCSRWWGPHSLP
jgi:hypothetical protein